MPVGHRSCHPGKRVRVKLRDGTVMIDKFIDSRSAYIMLEEHGKVFHREIASFVILKERER